MQNSENHAAWLRAKQAPLEVAVAPMPQPGPGEVLVRSRALAVNPFDGIVQTLGGLVTPWVRYPAVLGSDVAGEVVAVGPEVDRLHLGDRVLGLALGVDRLANRPAEGAFQRYVILRQDAVTVLPHWMAYEQAAVLPLAIATAACGLFLEDQLALRVPTAEPMDPTGKTVLIWGGSTSVGSAAIQLARAAGYAVATTASPRNFAYVRELGATQVFDYKAIDVVDQMADALRNSELVGALAISPGSAGPCIDAVSRCRGRQFVSMASSPLSIDDAPLSNQFPWRLTRLPRLAVGFAALAMRSSLKGVKTRSIWGTALVKGALGRAIFQEFLGQALASGVVIPAPPPRVVGHSLDALPAAIAQLRQGVSATKLVVSLPA